jgi:hypothetical protein
VGLASRRLFICALLTVGYITATFHVFFGCNDALTWLVLGPPTLSSFAAAASAIWAFRRVDNTAGKSWWVVAGLISVLIFALLAVVLYFSLHVPCEFFPT